MKSPEKALITGNPGDSRNSMELWICVRRSRELQIPTISIMDDFCFDGLGVVQAQKIGRKLCIKISVQGCPGTSKILQWWIRGKWIIDILALQI